MGLAYERLGAGPPLVLLHGIGHRRQAWKAVLARIAPHRDVILVDLPGHGESSPLETAGRPVATALVGEIIGLLDELGLDRPHLAGSSLGGRLALEAAVGHRAASVTAFSPAGFWRSSGELAYAKSVCRAMQVAGRLIRPVGPALARSTAGRALLCADLVSRPSKMGPEQLVGDMQAFLAARRTMEMILAVATPFTGTVPADVPLTIAWGSRDHLLLPGQALVAKKRLPQARLVALPGCGHIPMTDDPQLVSEVLLRGSQTASGPLAQPTQVGLSAPDSVHRRACRALSSHFRTGHTESIPAHASARGRELVITRHGHRGTCESSHAV